MCGLVERLVDGMKTFDKRYTRRHTLLVVSVLFAKKLDQIELLVDDAALEELPGGDGVGHETNGVGQDHLGAHRPHEPAEIGRMSHERVETARD